MRDNLNHYAAPAEPDRRPLSLLGAAIVFTASLLMLLAIFVWAVLQAVWG